MRRVAIVVTAVLVVAPSAWAAAPPAAGTGRLTAQQLSPLVSLNAAAVSDLIDEHALVQKLPEACAAVNAHPQARPAFKKLVRTTNAQIQSGSIELWTRLLSEFNALEAARAPAYTGSDRAKFDRIMASLQLALKLDIEAAQTLQAAVTAMGGGDCSPQDKLQRSAEDFAEGNDRFHEEISALTALAKG